MNTFENTLEAIMQLDFELREMLIEIVNNRQIEERRKEIAKNAHKARKEYQSGKLKPMSASEVMAELNKKLKVCNFGVNLLES
jgi:hypothetical protein